MKKIIYLLISLTLLININACTGYEPIFGSSKLQFEIVDYLITGDKKIGNKIYSKLKGISQKKKTEPEAKSIYILINSKKNTVATSKDDTGKTLEYKIILDTKVTINDFLTNKKILDHNFTFSLTYKVQDQHFETIKAGNKSLENLINKTYQELVVKLTQNMTIE